MVVTVVSKSATRALIETFIADWSSTMTNWAMASATSGNQFIFAAGAASAFGSSAAVTVGLQESCPVNPGDRVLGVTHAG